MPRKPKAVTVAHRELGDEDVSFANDLVDKGMVPKASIKRVLNVISATERHSSEEKGQGSPSNGAKRLHSPSFQSKKVDLQAMPRTWKEADKMASYRASTKPKTRKSPPRSMTRPKVPTDTGMAAEVRPSRKKKSLYPSSKGPKRDTRSASPPPSTSQRGKVNSSKLALRDAVLRGDSSYIRTLLRGGDCDVEYKDRATGSTLLHICAYEGLLEVADILIANGANVNQANKNQEGPLHWAASSDSANIAQLLLDFGADMVAIDDSGSTPLMRASAAGSPHVLAVLLARGGDVNAADYDGFNSVDLMEQCLAEEPRPETDAGLGEGALAAGMLMLRHITSRREEGDTNKDEEEEKAEEKRLQVTQRLQKAIERRMTSHSGSNAANDQHGEAAASGTSASAPLRGMLTKEESMRDEFQAAISETAQMIQAAQKDGTHNDLDSPGSSKTSSPVVAPAATVKGSRRFQPLASKKLVWNGGSRKDARERLFGQASRKTGQAFKLGDDSVTPLRKRVEAKFAPAKFVPFLPNDHSARTGDVIVAIEQCADCENHGWNVRHDAKRYANNADRCLIAVTRGFLEKKLPVRVFALKDVPSRARLGALEVTIAVRNAPGAKKPWTTHTAFSKLDSKSWPSAKKVASTARNFLKWALKAGGVTKKEDAPAAPESLSDIIEEEDEENERESVTSSVHVPEPEPEEAKIEAPVDWESRLISMEKQFMAWLMRLSAKGDAPKIAAPPILDLLGAGAAMSTPLEMCRRRVAQKGSFVPTFMELALGDGGGELTDKQFDALVLEHFFVFSAVDGVDTALLDALPTTAASSTPAEVHELKPGASLEGEPDSESKTQPQPLTIDIEAVDHSKQGKASSSVLGMDSPLFDIIEKRCVTEDAPDCEGEGDGNGDNEGVGDGHEQALGDEPGVAAEKEEKEEDKKPLLLAVGTRIEGNYMGSGQWYKGVITAASHSGGYDLEYDDDETEHGVKTEWVREVKRLPFHIRMEQKAQREAQAKEEEDPQREEEDDEKVAEEDPLSPVNQEETASLEVAEDPFLQLSASEGG